MSKGKTIMIVDDSDVDRMMLNAMLCGDFEVVEKCGGYTAVDFLKERSSELDVMLLDVSMPGMDGFGVLQFMKEAGINNFPVFLITAEATRDNVEKATQFGVTEFIRKPFEKEDIIKKIQQRLGIFFEHKLSNVETREIYRYISELEVIYKRYLINFGEDYEHYTRISDLMKIMLTKYAQTTGNGELDRDHIQIISKAGFFCNIGHMVVPPKEVKILKSKKLIRDGYKNHTILGAEFISLNHAEPCRYFVDICTDICMHHHERYDGTGYPHKIAGEHNVIYTQICRLADAFDSAYAMCRERTEWQFESVLGELERDKGNVSAEVFSMFLNCRQEVFNYYRTID